MSSILDQHRRGWLLIVLMALNGCAQLPSTPGLQAVYQQLQLKSTRQPDLAATDLAELDDQQVIARLAQQGRLSEDDAVAIALRHNAAFQELLVELSIARSDLVQAGLLPNPELAYTLGVSNKPFKYLLDLPVEAIWLRPMRLRAAQHDSEATYQRLVQAGLNLMRDVRNRYAERVLVQERLAIAEASLALREEIAALSHTRHQDGDISEQEATVSAIEAISARRERTRLAGESELASAQLFHVLGIPAMDVPVSLSPRAMPACQALSTLDLTQQGYAARPDIQAARLAIAAARDKARLAEVSWFRLLGVADATSGSSGHVLSPALRVTLPVLNHNQGGSSRAQAEIDRAERKLTTLQQQVALEVQQAVIQYRLSCSEWAALETQLLPMIAQGREMASKAYQDGSISYLTMLESDRQLLDNRLRQAVVKSELFKTWAEIDRSIGLATLPAPSTIPPASPQE